MNTTSKNINWLKHLHLWLTGETRLNDEKSLDAGAKADPFLAEALEGYRTLPEGNHAASVTRLKANLRLRTRREKGAGFYLLRVAAIGVVLVVAWGVFRQFSSKEPSQTGIQDIAAAHSAEQKQSDTTLKEPEMMANTQSTDVQPTVYPTEPTVKTETTGKKVSPSIHPQKDSRIASREQASPPSDQGATVQIPEKNETNLAVFDNMESQVKDEAITIKKESQTEEKPIQHETDKAVSVAPKPTAPAKEQTVEDQQKAPIYTEEIRTAETPAPNGGFKKLEKYIRENLRYPAPAAQAGIKGTVKLRFLIKADGSPTDFELINSLGYGCDEEAIRLLKQGPKWKGNPEARVTYSIVFE
jgi:TonB family protein